MFDKKKTLTINFFPNFANCLSGIFRRILGHSILVIHNNIGKLECEHKYHQKCIERWLMEKTICPLCKYNVLSSNNTGLVLDDNPEPENNEMSLEIVIR